jgi:type I restriction enzyme, S subunit
MKNATFSSARLLELYDRLSDAEDAIPRLRRFVLDLAVRGKLVEQDAGDEPATELLKRIAQEKARLVNAGKIKRQAAQPPISEDEMPFGLPTGWAWTRLGEIGLVGSSSRVLQNDWQSRGVPFYRAREIVELSKNGIVDNELFISEERFQELSKKGNVPEAGDIMITGVGTIGVPYVVLNDDRFYFKDASVLIFKNIFNLYPNFMFLVMTSPYWVEKVHIGSMGTTVHTLTINRAQPIILPMPPLAEQHRIVAKVEELMALCDQLEQARAGCEAVRDRLTTASLARLTAPETDAEAFQSHARFALQSLPTLTTRPDQIKTLRQTILNLAVRGKLVAQDPTAEPAAELLAQIAKRKAELVKLGEIRATKPLAPIAAADAPFETPSGWVPIRLGTVIYLLSGQHLQPPEYSETPGSGVPYITGPSDFTPMGLNISRYALVRKAVAKIGQLLLTVKGSGVGKTTICDIPEVAISRQLMSLTPIGWSVPFLEIITHRLAEVLQSQARSLIPGIAREDVEGFVFPLPPLEEQHRIVAKVNALMALCDQMEASLTTTATTRSKLLNVLLHEALEPPQQEVA